MVAQLLLLFVLLVLLSKTPVACWEAATVTVTVAPGFPPATPEQLMLYVVSPVILVAVHVPLTPPVPPGGVGPGPETLPTAHEVVLAVDQAKVDEPPKAIEVGSAVKPMV
ncbi:MAG: hypothetical protein A2760_00685 [Candidatus Doudnabacteria bacterium RIFCSPHIGHO2_01_FULL_50_67]|nr:MAG: hypothetical protein A2760_00685 [Candidatus Doudnabacteria bacterium RIFCSPHIGHO2_01_FULL_50_67]OGE96844.1 MAG: hypothetical protein A2990_03340 [Candidatus Doudnabacteria bacterium RIFCSPLOWO2_01_FULL_49_40]